MHPPVSRELPASHDVRRAGVDDWHHLRAVRLAALADSPSAFGSTLAVAQSSTEDEWREWIRTAAIFLASRQGVPIGMAAGMEGDNAGQRRLVAVWVHPAHRAGGLATSMVEAVESWARHEGAVELALWVTRTNDAAIQLYRKLRFAPSGKSKPLPSDPTLIEDQWARSLGQSRARAGLEPG